MAGPVGDASDTSPEADQLGWRSSGGGLRAHVPRNRVGRGRERGPPVAVASASPQDGDAWGVIYTGVRPENRRRAWRDREAKLHEVVGATWRRS